MYNPQLETFLRVADAGSFNKAAEDSFITPTAVIKQINLLERSLDVKLFERTHRGLKLTKAGQSLYQDAKYIIQYCRESVVRAKNAMQNEDTVIRIGSSPMTPAQLLVQLWPEFQEYCPDMKFEIIPFENTPENAREILANLGKNIDIIGGIFDPLALKEKLQIHDLYGQNLLLMHRGWSSYVDQLRDDLWKNHSEIHIIDFDFYNTNIFNRCENTNDVLLAIPGWANVHPLLKVIPVEWEYSIPYGLLHSHHPTEPVKKFLSAVKLSRNLEV